MSMPLNRRTTVSPRHRGAYRAVLVLVAMLATTAATAAAGWAQTDTDGQESQLRFHHGVDRSAWYQQGDSGGGLTGLLGWLLSPPETYEADSLPVALESGESTMVSAVRFDLAARELPADATITDFTLTIAAAGAADLAADPSAGGIRACAAAGSWSAAEAGGWDARPSTGDDCVSGVPQEMEAADPADGEVDTYWSFDLSAMASAWVADPSTNHGVVFEPERPDDADSGSWQADLKLPVLDDAGATGDAGVDTSGRVVVALSHRPAATAADDTRPDRTPVTQAPDTGATPERRGAESPRSRTGTGPVELPPGELTPAPAAASSTWDEPASVGTPAYAWLLLPVGLLTALLGRSLWARTRAPAAGGGLVGAIRQRNAHRRGGQLRGPAGPWGRLRAVLRRGR